MTGDEKRYGGRRSRVREMVGAWPVRWGRGYCCLDPGSPRWLGVENRGQGNLREHATRRVFLTEEGSARAKAPRSDGGEAGPRPDHTCLVGCGRSFV